eukprot:6949825-Karenia_brevis.AAC.1
MAQNCRRGDFDPRGACEMLALRSEMQVAGDWIAVPAARNLHWRTIGARGPCAQDEQGMWKLFND